METAGEACIGSANNAMAVSYTHLVGIASRTLKSHGMPDQAKEMADRVFSCDSYHKALCIIGEYVNITSADREAERPHSIRQQLKNGKATETAAPKKAAKEPER